MILFDNLMYYFFSLLLSLIIVHNIKIRIEQRIGLSENFLKLFIRSIHGIIIKLPIILLLFFSSHVVSTYAGINNTFVLCSLLMIMITITPYRAKRYGFMVINAATFLSIIVVAFTAMTTITTGKGWFFLHNPFTVLSFLIGILLIAIINNDDKEPLPLNISRNLSMNIFLASLYVVHDSFMYAAIIGVVCICIQYVVKLIMPKLNVHRNMEYSLSIVLTATLFCFVGNIVWLMMLEGKSVLLLFRI